MGGTLPSSPRPRSVTVLALGVLTIAGSYSARLILALVYWQGPVEFPGPSQMYIAFTGLAWAFVAWPLALGLWRGKIWARRVMRLAVFVFSGYYWLDRLIVANIGNLRSLSLPVNWPFMAVMNGLVILSVYWILSRQKSKEFFGEVHERKS